MLLAAQKVINCPISESSRPLSVVVQDFFVDSQTGKVTALKIGREKLIFFSDVKNFFQDKIIIFPNTQREVAKDQKFKRIQKDVVCILGNKTVTTSGRLLGELRDFEFDSISGQVEKYYVKAPLVKKLFKGQLIIPRDAVVALEESKVIVKDNIIQKKKRFKVFQKKETTVPAGATVARG